jgi:predicted Na+-dependent transporter
MDLVDQLLGRLGRRATTLLPFSLAIGLVFQSAAAFTRPLVGPLAILLLMLALIRTDWPRVRLLLARPWLAIALAVANLLVVPLIVWPIWQALGLWPGLVAALCLSAMAPGIISATTTAAFLRLDSSLALLVTLFTNFLVPFTLPPLALWLLGLDLKLSVGDLSLRLAFIIGTALAGALVVRAVMGGPRLRRSATAIDGLSVIVLMVFAVPLMDGIVARAEADPWKLAGFVGGAFAGMLLCNVVMALLTLPFLDRRTALTAGYCSGGRHNALLMAVLPITADPDIFLFIAAVQVPIYIIPTLLQPLYRRLLREEPSGVAAGD